MFHSILVPLDGSILAEQALLPAGEIARRLEARLTLALVHPLGPREDAPFAGTGPDQDLRAEEGDYLRKLRDHVTGTFAVNAEVAVLSGEPVRALAGFARERAVDLVVAGTHGRGAVARALGGGVALELAHALSCPALLLKLQHGSAVVLEPEGVRRILVPLDASADAEASVEPALALAASRGVALFLVRVISPLVRHRDLLVEERRRAQRDLGSAADRLERRGLRVDYRVLVSSDTAHAVVRAAERWDVDLIALTTRRRSEGARLLLGSVADSVVRSAGMPVLIAHAARDQARDSQVTHNPSGDASCPTCHPASPSTPSAPSPS